ncbi:hypothetical protein HOLleu_13052 [Holothuria leucospilota]|uniref:Uncharacterized protein n=1 Tax=Holothuria leucospilota TaxID=206669 RepID=A0A9Q1HDE5_HOLLE|nr:hypothetical protein HOLleu_13052 [Holothuria leucospilota]
MQKSCLRQCLDPPPCAGTFGRKGFPLRPDPCQLLKILDTRLSWPLLRNSPPPPTKKFLKKALTRLG